MGAYPAPRLLRRFRPSPLASAHGTIFRHPRTPPRNAALGRRHWPQRTVPSSNAHAPRRVAALPKVAVGFNPRERSRQRPTRVALATPEPPAHFTMRPNGSVSGFPTVRTLIPAALPPPRGSEPTDATDTKLTRPSRQSRGRALRLNPQPGPPRNGALEGRRWPQRTFPSSNTRAPRRVTALSKVGAGLNARSHLRTPMRPAA